MASEAVAEDLREFGSSGRIFDAATTLEAITPAIRPRLVFEDLQALTVATDVVLVTYVLRSVAGPGWKPPALRSSLWCWREGRWDIRIILLSGRLRRRNCAR